MGKELSDSKCLIIKYKGRYRRLERRKASNYNKLSCLKLKRWWIKMARWLDSIKILRLLRRGRKWVPGEWLKLWEDQRRSGARELVVTNSNLNKQLRCFKLPQIFLRILSNTTKLSIQEPFQRTQVVEQWSYQTSSLHQSIHKPIFSKFKLSNPTANF